MLRLIITVWPDGGCEEYPKHVAEVLKYYGRAGLVL